MGVYHFLASNQSRYVTEHAMVVNGGRLTAYHKSVLTMLEAITASRRSDQLEPKQIAHRLLRPKST